MERNFEKIQDLLRLKAELTARLNLIPYDGTVEIKEVSSNKYLYIRKRLVGKIQSNYVGLYSQELHELLLRQVKDAKELRKQIKLIDKELAKLNYSESELTPKVSLNIDFARKNMKTIIYDQAILEGVSTTFPDTELILENGKVNNMTSEDVLKIINLKHAWEFILDKDVILSPTSYYVSQYTAKLINEGFYQDGGRIRLVPVRIGGTEYIPPIPSEEVVRATINNIINDSIEDIDKAIEIALYIMKTQVFIDGNKRTAIILANHYLVSKGKGILVIPYNKVSEFKKLLVAYYEGNCETEIKKFLKEECYQQLS
jgi:Fic family protein